MVRICPASNSRVLACLNHKMYMNKEDRAQLHPRTRVVAKETWRLGEEEDRAVDVWLLGRLGS
jgi:hypothetical protein